MDEKNDLYELCFSRKAVHRRRRRRVKLRRLRFAVVLCFFAVVLCVGVGQLLAVQTVKSIVFTGQQHYSDAILADKLSVQVGDAMYGVDTEGVTEKLLSSCPYLATVEIERSLRGVLTVHMTQRDARYALCVDEGGYLLYSTCTVNTAENEDNIKYILETYPQLSLIDENGSEAYGTQLLPHTDGTDGFFYAAFERK
jgi:cell division septal protein FtsQ